MGRMSLHGHYWTLVPHFTRALRPPPLPESRFFSTNAEDVALGTVRLTGRLSEVDGARGLLLIVHGLGGWSQSKYVFDAARTARSAGLACLRLNLRGADRLGEDYYHAGLWTDIECALASPMLDRYDRIFVLGYSIGGHVALWYAIHGTNPRVRAIASVCAPLDLDASADEIDRMSRVGYRLYVLRGLKQMYAAVAAQRPVPVPLKEAMKIRTLRGWDDRVVAPRFGFADARDYYRKVSVGPRLKAVATPTFIVQTRHDPMVLEHTVRPSLESVSRSVSVRWLDHGGHVGFPEDIDLGVSAARGLEPQIVAWLERQG
jgi:predicted alpha/beta-fold hydrolase